MYSISVLIGVVIALVLLVIAVIVIVCRLYLWDIIFKKKHHYVKLSTSKSDNDSKIGSGNVSRNEVHLRVKDTSNSKTNPYWRYSSDRFDSSNRGLYRSQQLDSQSDASSSDIFHFDDSLSAKSSGSELDGRDFSGPYSAVPPARKLTKKTKMRFSSEPILNIDFDKTNNVPDMKSQRRFIKKRTKSSKALSVLVPVAGQIEFSLFYDPDERSLVINIIQLTNIALTVESFANVLEVFDQDSTERKYKPDNVHLIRTSDGKLKLSRYTETGFSIRMTLLNKKNFLDQSTSTVFGEQTALFNDKFVISGKTLEQLSSASLYMHALCAFGRNCEPIVIGEVKVPLKRIQPSQLLPFMANFMQPEIDVVLEVSEDLRNLSRMMCKKWLR